MLALSFCYYSVLNIFGAELYLLVPHGSFSRCGSISQAIHGGANAPFLRSFLLSLFWLPWTHGMSFAILLIPVQAPTGTDPDHVYDGLR